MSRVSQTVLKSGTAGKANRQAWPSTTALVGVAIALSLPLGSTSALAQAAPVSVFI